MATDYLDHLSRPEFEDLVLEFLHAMGFEIRQTSPTDNGGMDAVVESDRPIVNGHYFLQFRRNHEPVGPFDALHLYEAVRSSDASKGVLFTSSTLTDEARQFVRDRDLELVGGDELRELLVEYLDDFEVPQPDDPETQNVESHNGTPDAETRVGVVATVAREEWIPLREEIGELDENGEGFEDRQYESLTAYQNFLDRRIERFQSLNELLNERLGKMKSYANRTRLDSMDVDFLRQYARGIIPTAQEFIQEWKEVRTADPPTDIGDEHDVLQQKYQTVFDHLDSVFCAFQDYAKRPGEAMAEHEILARRNDGEPLFEIQELQVDLSDVRVDRIPYLWNKFTRLVEEFQQGNERPFPRLGARVIDYSLFAVLCFLAGGVPGVDLPFAYGFIGLPLLTAAWVPIEALLLLYFLTTPGKALLGLKLQPRRASGYRYPALLQRSFLVWVLGVGGGIPGVNAVTVTLAGWRLHKQGSTLWDENRFTVVAWEWKLDRDLLNR